MKRRETLKTGASIIAGMSVVPVLNACTGKTDKNAIDSFWEVVKNRRSVRLFKPDPVPEEHLMKIIDAARMAPNAGNEQAWKFIIVQDKKLIQAMKDECAKNIEKNLVENNKLSGDALKEEVQKRVDNRITGRLSAPAYIVVLSDKQRQYPSYNRHDGPLAAGYLLLAAQALGYGTVYMTDSIPVDVTRKVLNIPDRYERVCITPVGIPAEDPHSDKKPLEEFIIKEKFSG
jgi:nitroreductase